MTYNITLFIFILSYLGLAFDGLPKVTLDRASIAFIGAAAMLLFTPFNVSQLPHVIGIPLLTLLLSMMIIVAYLDISGFFALAIYYGNRLCKTPTQLLAVIIAITGLLSAFLINDIVCLAITPLVIHICKQRRLPMLPYLMAVGTAANIGSVATLTGNPQNMLISHFCHIPYRFFFYHAAPIAVLCLAIDFALILLFFRKSLRTATTITTPTNNKPLIEKPFLLVKTLIVTLLVILLFFTHLPLALTALGAAAFLLLDNTPKQKVYRLIDGSLLLLFIGLFILVAALQQFVMSSWHIGNWTLLTAHPLPVISISVAILSNLVSNVPAVLLFKPIVPHLANPQTIGIYLAVMSTLAGNLTILGSLANLIVVTIAKKQGVSISFKQFFKLGLPLTLLTLIPAYLLLSILH